MLKKIKIFLFLLFLCKIEHIFTFFYNTHIQSLDPALNCAQEPRVSTSRTYLTQLHVRRATFVQVRRGTLSKVLNYVVLNIFHTLYMTVLLCVIIFFSRSPCVR